MANNTEKASQLIVRLLNKTQIGDLVWERFSDGYTFQTRLGNFLIVLAMDVSDLMQPVTIRVTKLDGSRVFASSSQAFSKQLSDGTVTTPVSITAGQQMKELYQVVSQSNPDIDELLSLL